MVMLKAQNLSKVPGRLQIVEVVDEFVGDRICLFQN